MVCDWIGFGVDELLELMSKVETILAKEVEQPERKCGRMVTVWWSDKK